MSAWALIVHVQLTHDLQIFVDHKTPLSLLKQAKANSWCSQTKPTVPENTNSCESNKSDMYNLFSDASKVNVEKNNEHFIVEKYRNTKILETDNDVCETGFKTTSQKVLGCVEMLQKDSKKDLSVSESSNLTLSGNNSEVVGSIDTGLSLRSITRTVLMENNTPNPNRDRDKILSAVQPNERVRPVTLISKLSTPAMTVGGKDSITAGNMSIIQHPIPQLADTLNIAQDGPKSLPPTENSFNTLPVVSRSLPEAPGKKIDATQDQDIVEHRNNSGDGGETDMDECCDDQGCGVTVIPGSHQHLQKCCNAVVPKKRKRHIELKHMPFSWSSSRYARRRMLQRSFASGSKSASVNNVEQSPTGTSTIFIDVEPDTLGHTDKNHNTDNQQGTKSEMKPSDTLSNSKSLTTIPMNVFPSGSESRTKSLILQPGAVFSIPFSYSVPSSVSGTAASIPISIVHAQSSENQDDSSTVAFGKLVPIVNASNDESQLQVSVTEGQGNGGSPGEISVGETDLRRRKYPTSKPFQCDKCPMAFNQRIHLKKHMSKHTGKICYLVIFYHLPTTTFILQLWKLFMWNFPFATFFLYMYCCIIKVSFIETLGFPTLVSIFSDQQACIMCQSFGFYEDVWYLC